MKAVKAGTKVQTEGQLGQGDIVKGKPVHPRPTSEPQPLSPKRALRRLENLEASFSYLALFVSAAHHKVDVVTGSKSLHGIETTTIGRQEGLLSDLA